MKRIFVILLLMAAVHTGAAEKKDISIIRIGDTPVIDGELDEPFWQLTESGSEFKQHSPVAGAPSCRKTEIKMVYDDNAVYIGAIMYDDRDSMSLTLSQRDELGNADWFGVIFDPYNAGTIGFAFMVTSAGVQVDELHQVDNIDENWNAVWQSEVSVHDDRWIAELKIPFSALRFPKKSDQVWGINFARNIRRHREESFWNFYDPNGINLISQLGTVQGISNINTPMRLSLTPYVSGYVENYNGTNGYTTNGGMDLKYGLNDAFTLDMTLIPDFGQVQFDNQVLNLSPFEVYYNERRQFFTEGTELFNKGDLFYSRRVGSMPFNYSAAYSNLDSTEIVESNPDNSQLLNATKISGRTSKGLGIGAFNAVSGRAHATIRDTVTNDIRFEETNPLTNYNVLVFDQNLKHNSSLTLINTNVMREGYAHDANVMGIGGDIYTEGQKYNFWGSFVSSQIYSETDPVLGHRIMGGVGKSAGSFQWNVVYKEFSKDYNPNDLGFQTVTNLREGALTLRYNIYKPFWKLYRMWSSFVVGSQRIIIPDAYAHSFVSADVGGTFRNFMTVGAWIYGEPIKNHDYFEPRTPGRYYENDESVAFGGFISSNYSKPFALDMNAGTAFFNDDNRWGLDLTISPRFRFSDRYFMVYSLFMSIASNEEGAALTNNFSLPFDGDNPIFAVRDRNTVTNTVDASYIFNNKMGITFRLRHYWAKVQYDEFYALNEQGQFDPTSYSGFDINDQSLHDNSFNAFTIDMAYRWVFAPGSELSLVWKNSIFNYSQDVALNYFENVGTMAGLPATNSISLKILYYIDYWSLHQKLFRKSK